MVILHVMTQKCVLMLLFFVQFGGGGGGGGLNGELFYIKNRMIHVCLDIYNLYKKQNDTCMLGHIQFIPRVDKDIISTTAHSCIVLFSISIQRIHVPFYNNAIISKI